MGDKYADDYARYHAGPDIIDDSDNEGELCAACGVAVDDSNSVAHKALGHTECRLCHECNGRDVVSVNVQEPGAALRPAELRCESCGCSTDQTVTIEFNGKCERTLCRTCFASTPTIPGYTYRYASTRTPRTRQDSINALWLAGQFPFPSNPCFADEPMDWAKLFTGGFSKEAQDAYLARRNGGAS